MMVHVLKMPRNTPVRTRRVVSRFYTAKMPRRVKTWLFTDRRMPDRLQRSAMRWVRRHMRKESRP